MHGNDDGSGWGGYRSWSLRLVEDEIPDFDYKRIDAECAEAYDEALSKFDMAHVVMLTEAGILPSRLAAELLSELRVATGSDERAQGRGEYSRHRGENVLTVRLGVEKAGWIGLGRSTGDLGAVARRLVLRDLLLALACQINSLRATCLDLSTRHRRVLMPGYTHGQVAQPTTFGHWISMFACVFERDFERIAGAFSRVNMSSAGAGIMTGTDWSIDRWRVAELLGFGGLNRHTMDAILSHDSDLLEPVSALAIVSANLARVADDIESFMGRNARLVDVPDRFCGTSSIMMQKRNPVFAERIRASVADALAALTAGFTAERGPTGLAMAERSLAERAIFTAYRATVSRAQLLDEALRNICVNAAAMSRELDGSWATASDLATALVRKGGVSWRMAHRVVSAFVRAVVDNPANPPETDVKVLDLVSKETIGISIELTSEEMRAALSADGFVQRRTLVGGPEARAHDAETERLARRLEADRANVQEWRDRIAESDVQLRQTTDHIIESHLLKRNPNARDTS